MYTHRLNLTNSHKYHTCITISSITMCNLLCIILDGKNMGVDFMRAVRKVQRFRCLDSLLGDSKDVYRELCTLHVSSV